MGTNYYRKYRRIGTISTLLAFPGFILFIFASAALASVVGYDPFCRVTTQYETSATIRYGGQEYTSQATVKKRTSRGWIRQFNGGGCNDPIGNAFIFRTSGDRLLMTRAKGICSAASDEMRKTGSSDVIAACPSWFEKNDRKIRHDVKASGIWIDDAENPKSWQPFWYDHVQLKEGQEGSDLRVQIVDWTISKTRKEPADEIEAKAPSLLKVWFEGGDYASEPRAFIGSVRSRSKAGEAGPSIIERKAS